MSEDGLPDHLRDIPKEMEETIRTAVEQATRHMEEVVFPAQRFVYPKGPEISKVEDNHDFSYRTVEFDTPTLVENVVQTTRKSAQYLIEPLDQNTSLEMIYVPGGSFIMGEPDLEHYAGKPQHSVTLPAFHLGRFAVTQKQWQTIMHHNLSLNRGENLPVENVSWNDATEFCSRLSRLTGRNYRLPNEAEWEYACRAGTTTAYSFGDEITTQMANYWDMSGDIYSSTDETEPIDVVLETVSVGSFHPNAFGLYNMHGNVYELCQDRYFQQATDIVSSGIDSYDEGQAIAVVIKGGSCDYYAYNCRSAYRSDTLPSYRYGGTGFRLACSI